VVAAALLIVNTRVCLISLRGLVAADDPKPEEAPTKEGKRGGLANRGLGEREGVYLVICYGVTALVVRVVVGTAVAPNVAFCARNREHDAPRVKSRSGPRIHDVVVNERAEWKMVGPRIKWGAEQAIDWIAVDGAGERGDVEATTVGCPAVSVPDPVSVPESVQS